MSAAPRRARPGVDAPVDVLAHGVVLAIGTMDATVAAEALPDLSELRDAVRLLADRPARFDVRGGRRMDDGGRTIMIPDHPFTAMLVDERTGTTRAGDVVVRETGGVQNRYTLVRDGLNVGITIVESIAADGVSHSVEVRERPRATPTIAALADTLDLAVRVCRRVADDDRVISAIDMAAVETVMRDLVLVGDDGADRVTLASPWSDAHGTMPGLPPLDADHRIGDVDPAAVARLRAAMDRHWMLRDGVPVVGIGITNDVISIGSMTRQRRVGRTAGDPQGIERLRRHAADLELRRRIAGWGLCTPPGDDA